MKMYTVTFAWDESNSIYCTNLCRAESAEAAKAYYEEKYQVLGVTECNPVEAESYLRRGMPVTNIKRKGA